MSSKGPVPANVVNAETLQLLDLHHDAFYGAKVFADRVAQSVPCDTAAWSQILVGLITGIGGLARKKGQDLADGSDVKAANAWEAIDKPRFNGVLPAGRTSATSKKAPNVAALDDIPNIYFVLWDHTPVGTLPRCRVWCVRTDSDTIFRAVAAEWYKQRASGSIKSSNFQLHPSIGSDLNVVRNRCGNLALPLLLVAVREQKFVVRHLDMSVVTKGACKLVP